MTIIKQSLLKDKFALANFILLNSSYCEISRDELYVVQVVEQFQNQFQKSLDFSKLEEIICIDIQVFKLNLHSLQEKNFIVSEFKLINEINTLQYNFEPFWNYVVEKVTNFDKLFTQDKMQKDFVSLVSDKFNRLLNTQEISQIESIISVYEYDVLEEALRQVLVMESPYVSTIVEILSNYQEANCLSVDSMKLEFENMRG